MADVSKTALVLGGGTVGAALLGLLYNYLSSNDSEESSKKKSKKKGKGKAKRKDSESTEDEPMQVRGLKNIGNTCFMNSILQSLCNAPQFHKFLAAVLEKDPENEFVRVFLQTVQPPKKEALGIHNPREFHDLIVDEAELFRGNAQHDAHELFNYLMGILENKIVHHKDTTEAASLSPAPVSIDQLLKEILPEPGPVTLKPDPDFYQGPEIPLIASSPHWICCNSPSSATSQPKPTAEEEVKGSEQAATAPEPSVPSIAADPDAVHLYFNISPDGQVDITSNPRAADLIHLDFLVSRSLGISIEAYPPSDTAKVTASRVPVPPVALLFTVSTAGELKIVSKLASAFEAEEMEARNKQPHFFVSSAVNLPSGQAAMPLDPFSGQTASFVKCADCYYESPIKLDSFRNITLHIPQNFRPTAKQPTPSISGMLEDYVAAELVEQFKCLGCSVRASISAIKGPVKFLVELGDAKRLALLSGYIRRLMLTDTPNSPEEAIVRQFLDAKKEEEERKQEAEEKKQEAEEKKGGAAGKGGKKVVRKDGKVVTRPTVSSTDKKKGKESAKQKTPAQQLAEIDDLISRINIFGRGPVHLEECIEIVRSKAAKRLKFTRLPPILCFHVNRLVAGMKLDTPVSFPFLMDMSDSKATSTTDLVQIPAEADVRGLRETPFTDLYIISSVVCHHGSPGAGHFTTYRRVQSQQSLINTVKDISRYIDILTRVEVADHRNRLERVLKLSEALNTAQWVHTSDETVQPAPVKEVQTCQAYLIFYEKVE